MLCLYFLYFYSYNWILPILFTPKSRIYVLRIFWLLTAICFRCSINHVTFTRPPILNEIPWLVHTTLDYMFTNIPTIIYSLSGTWIGGVWMCTATWPLGTRGRPGLSRAPIRACPLRYPRTPQRTPWVYRVHVSRDTRRDVTRASIHPGQG